MEKNKPGSISSVYELYKAKKTALAGPFLVSWCSCHGHFSRESFAKAKLQMGGLFSLVWWPPPASRQALTVTHLHNTWRAVAPPCKFIQWISDWSLSAYNSKDSNTFLCPEPPETAAWHPSTWEPNVVSGFHLYGHGICLPHNSQEDQVGEMARNWHVTVVPPCPWKWDRECIGVSSLSTVQSHGVLKK